MVEFFYINRITLTDTLVPMIPDIGGRCNLLTVWSRNKLNFLLR
jgi:hypothetical protein